MRTPLTDSTLDLIAGGDQLFYRSPVNWYDESGTRFQGWYTQNDTGGSIEGYVTGGWDPRIEYTGARWEGTEAPDLSLDGYNGIVSE